MNTLLKFTAASCVWSLVIASMLILSGCASTGQITPAANTDIQNALLTTANVIQQLNTGLQTVAPSVSAILTLTHNQGDADAVNRVVTDSSVAQAALTTLLANVSTAVKSSTVPAAQIAAVNAATSPAAIAQIVAPINAASAAVPASN